MFDRSGLLLALCWIAAGLIGFTVGGALLFHTFEDVGPTAWWRPLRPG